MRSFIEYIAEYNVSFKMIESFLNDYIHDLKISDVIFDISDIEENKPIIITFKSLKDNDENDIRNLKITSVPLFRNKYITFKIEGSELMKDKVQRTMLLKFIKDLEKDFNLMLKRIGFSK